MFTSVWTCKAPPSRIWKGSDWSNQVQQQTGGSYLYACRDGLALHAAVLSKEAESPSEVMVN